LWAKLNAAGEILIAALYPQVSLCAEQCLNASVGASGDGNSVRIDECQLLHIGETGKVQQPSTQAGTGP
jgi:hypothetical protein